MGLSKVKFTILFVGSGSQFSHFFFFFFFYPETHVLFLHRFRQFREYLVVNLNNPC